MIDQNNSRKMSTRDKVIILALAAWILFGGGYSWLKSNATAKNINAVTNTIGTGVQRLGGSSGAGSLLPTIAANILQTATPASSTDSRRKDIKLPTPPARGAGAGAGSSDTGQPQATAAATVQPTAAAASSPTAMVAGGAPAAAPAAVVYVAPAGNHTEINPDGSFTVDNGHFRYYPDSTGAIIEIRIVDRNFEPTIASEGAPPEQKIFLDPEDAEDAAVLAQQPTAAPRTNTEGSSGRGRPRK